MDDTNKRLVNTGFISLETSISCVPTGKYSTLCLVPTPLPHLVPSTSQLSSNRPPPPKCPGHSSPQMNPPRQPLLAQTSSPRPHAQQLPFLTTLPPLVQDRRLHRIRSNFFLFIVPVHPIPAQNSRPVPDL
ncbi:hypothetical protein P167DRAFT_95522 [Morchella conica CCBAS932]|uniref:Uncharacterized protein n=1 Tax=Morchella conica CCBAS932 TaxID=1392247 RepID=A0A3N4KWV6_9PEZI|nr:hypothetical protein P167DRAFT_95522 [Morchella conica CCBAS932]